MPSDDPPAPTELQRRTHRAQGCTAVVERLPGGRIRKRYEGEGPWPGRRWRREKRILQRLADCPHVPRLLELGPCSLVLEDRGDPPLPALQPWLAALDAWLAVRNGWGLVHNDLHWPNVVAREGRVTLVDCWSLARRSTAWGRRRLQQFVVEGLLHAGLTPELRAVGADARCERGRHWIFLPASAPWPGARDLPRRRPDLIALLGEVEARGGLGPAGEPGLFVLGLRAVDRAAWARRFGLDRIYTGGDGRRGWLRSGGG